MNKLTLFLIPVVFLTPISTASATDVLETIINIKSNIKNELRSSATDFDCLRGSKMVNVALEGTVVTLGK